MRIKELRESRQVQQKELASILGIPSNTLSQYENEKREPSRDIVLKIAEYFGVSIDFIYGRTNYVTCKKCGLSYCPTHLFDIDVHDDYHRRWENAVKFFGKIYSNTSENERIKAENRNIVNNKELPLNKRYDAQLEVFRCLFSRSLSSCNFNEKHVDFKTYVSMMLNNSRLENQIGHELYTALVNNFGKKPGIPDGQSYYSIEHPSTQVDTIAAHFEGTDFSDEELDDIARYIEFVKSRKS